MMNKKKTIAIAVFAAVVLSLIVVQWRLSKAFCEGESRVEVHTTNMEQPGIPPLIKELSQSFNVEASDTHLNITTKRQEMSTLSQYEILRLVRIHKVEGAEVSDLSYTNSVIGQYLTLNFKMLELIFVIATAVFAVQFFKKYQKKYKEVAYDSYLSEIVEKHMVGIMIAVIIGVVLLFGALFAALDIVSFRIFIPQKYLPPKYIFDIGFYFSNTMKTGASQLSEYAKSYTTINSISAMILAVNTFLTVITAYLLLKKPKKTS